MMPVKICGIMNREDLLCCAKAGAYAVGLIVEYPVPVPWNLTVTRAEQLRRYAPDTVDLCLVTGGQPDEIIARARRIRPRAVQLHFEETLEETAYIADVLEKEQIRVVKSLRFGPAGRLCFEIPDPVQAARALGRTKVAALLVDSGTAARPGGSGIAVDRACYLDVAAHTRLPVILAGGLRADNLAALVPENPRPAALDVLTGVEAGPGRKDPAKVRAFLRAAQALTERMMQQ